MEIASFRCAMGRLSGSVGPSRNAHSCNCAELHGVEMPFIQDETILMERRFRMGKAFSIINQLRRRHSPAEGFARRANPESRRGRVNPYESVLLRSKFLKSEAKQSPGWRGDCHACGSTLARSALARRALARNDRLLSGRKAPGAVEYLAVTVRIDKGGL